MPNPSSRVVHNWCETRERRIMRKPYKTPESRKSDPNRWTTNAFGGIGGRKVQRPLHRGLHEDRSPPKGVPWKP